MNQKSLLGLVIIAVVVLVAAMALHHANKPLSETVEKTKALLPELDAHVNDIGKVVFTGAGNKTIATLTRGKNGWSIAEKGGYAADTGKLREFLLKLADAKVIEKKTANKAKYADLGVQDIADKDAKGVLAEIDGVGKPIRLIIGSPDSSGNGTFVRRVDDAQSLLVSGRLGTEKTAADWLGKDLADIDAKRIADVSVTRPDGKNVHVHKNAEGDADFTLADLPKGREIVSAYTVNGMASTLAGLRFDDVLPAANAMPDEKAIKARYSAFDGLLVDVVAWSEDGKDYAQFTASKDSARADEHIAAAQADAKAKAEADSASAKPAASDGKSPTAAAGDGSKKGEAAKPLAVTDPAKDRTAKLAALDKEIADLNARFSGWTYVLPSYKYSNIDKSIDDLLKPLESKAEKDKDKDKSKPAKKASKKVARSH